MSFGTASSTPVGGETLTGYIVSKATQSRKEAKKADKKERRKKEKKADTKASKKESSASKLLGSLPSLGNLFSAFKGGNDKKKPTRTYGGSTGLAKILTNGFGMLATDTSAVASGLSSVTQTLNSSLKAQTFTATGIQTIAGILSDQVENQGTILSTVKSLKRGGSGSGGKSMFGTSKSSGVGTGTLTEALINAAIEKGVGRFIASRLSRLNPFNNNTPKPKPPTGGSNNPKGGYYDDAVKRSQENARRLKKEGFMGKLKDIGEGFKGKASQAADYGKGLLGKAKGAGDNLVKGITGSPVARKLGMAGARFGGRMLPVAGTGFSAVEAADRAKKGDVVGAWLAGLGGAAGGTATVTSAAALTGAGAVVPAAAEGTSMIADIGLLGWDLINAFNPMSKMAEGGVMIGEAGREAVVDLNSNQGRDLMGQQDGDPGMKASGASTLAVVDQFIKGMGPLGAPVSQALGPDIQNLARTFGMSQTLPNIKIGGGKFKEDGNAKKTRDKFLEDLIAGSLDSLDAKKKTNAPPASPPPAQTTPQQQKQSNPSDPSTGSGTQIKKGSDGKPMDRHDPKAYGAGRQSVVAGTDIGVGITDVDTNRQTGELEANHMDFKYNGSDYKVRINPNNGDYEVFQTRGHLGLVDKQIDIGGPKGPKKGQANEALLRAAHNQVRRFFLVNAPQKGLSLQYINQTDIDNNEKAKKRALVNGDQQRGGIVRQEFDRGGLGMLDDFLRGSAGRIGSEIGGREGRRRTGGLPILGNIGESVGRKQGEDTGRKLYDTFAAPLRGQFEKGGSMFGTEGYNVNPLERRIKALEDIIAVTAITSAAEPVKPKPPLKASPSSAPVSATSEASSELNSAAIINIVGGGGGSPSIPMSQEKTQSTSDYIIDPNPGGLAGLLCSSPWSVV